MNTQRGALDRPQGAPGDRVRRRQEGVPASPRAVRSRRRARHDPDHAGHRRAVSEFDLYPAPPQRRRRTRPRQLLAQAGRRQQPNLTLVVHERPRPSSPQAQAIQQGLERAGITVTLKPEDTEPFYDRCTGDKRRLRPDVSQLAAGLPERERQHPAAVRHRSQIGNGGYNISRYSNPAVDTLIDQATAEIDQTKAQPLWAAGRQEDHGGRAGRAADLREQRRSCTARTCRTSSSRRSRRTRTT